MTTLTSDTRRTTVAGDRAPPSRPDPGPTGTATAHGPDPSLTRRAVRPEPGPRSSAGGPAPSRRRRSRRRSRQAAGGREREPRPRRLRRSPIRPRGANPIGYGVGATCGVNGIACFTRDAPDGFTMWLREQGHVFDWGTLKWCQAYAIRTEWLLRRRDDRPRRVRPRRWPRPSRQLVRRLRTTSMRSCRPTRGRSRAPAGTCTPSVDATRRRSRCATT